MITGKDFIDMGFKPGKWFGPAIDAANAAEESGASVKEIRDVIASFEPAASMPLAEPGGKPFHMNIEAITTDEAANVASVGETMSELMRTPVIKGGAVMPDACPTGGMGTIPVGGVAKSEHIHPGMHSADICCSVMLTSFGSADPIKLLDAAQKATHFGGGGRPRGKQIRPSANLMARMEANPFFDDAAISAAIEHHGTQGDGNHFLYVGRIRSTGETALVTHHGSRKPGALLYKAGMRAAQKYCRDVSPETLKANVWIDGESEDGRQYWEALQIIREWTKSNHEMVHDLAQEQAGMGRGHDRLWNEHNFVFYRAGHYYHAKGATPMWDYSDDVARERLIPLNMAEPILIVREHANNPAHGMGFAPHGAGRNFSRSEHTRRNVDRAAEEMIAEETKGIDARFWCGIPDTSELPSAYKRAGEVVRQIDHFELAEIVDYVDPIGCIMAGDWMRPFREKRRASS